MRPAECTEPVPPTADLAAMAAICAAFLAQEYCDAPSSAFQIGRRAKAILLTREGPTLAPITAGLRIKAALLTLHESQALTVPTNCLAACTLDGATLPTALRRFLGLPDAPPLQRSLPDSIQSSAPPEPTLCPAGFSLTW